MSDDDAGHGRGRPQKFPGEGARISHSLRLKPAVADRLRIAAQAANRTLGEEMELRIGRSFEIEDLSRDEVDAEVAKRAYAVSREAEYYRLHRAYSQACYDWDLANHQKYIKQLEDMYFNVRLRYIKKIRSFLGNRLTKFLVLEERMTENAVDKNHNDVKSFDEVMSSADMRGKQLKEQLELFDQRYPEMLEKEYIGSIIAIMARIEEVHREKRIVKNSNEGVR